MAASKSNIGNLPGSSQAAGDKSPQHVAITDTSGNIIETFGAGGGTQYTEGDTDASVTGTAVMWEDASDTLRVASLAKPLPVQATGGTTGGHSIFRSIDVDETEEEVKASAGTIYAILFTNTATTTRWLKIYNATAAAVIVGTTVPVITFGLPGNASDAISGAMPIPEGGIAFDTAICVAATTGVADADTGAPAANDVIVNVLYR